MPGPFPGMDPYLEDPARWPDVHQRLITYIADALQPHLRPRYLARIGERVYIVAPPQAMYPDVVLIRRPAVREAGAVYAVAEAEVAMETAEPSPDEPVIVTLPPTEHREPFVEIIHAGGEVVTVIEVLSPANKTPGEGHRLYRRKQQEILETPVHLVEIDLLSTGEHTVAVPEETRAELRPHRYLICVRRGPERHHFELYPIPLAKRLPRMRVPLKEPDPDVVLDLQGVFDRCYDNGGYAELVDYRKPPPVPLSPEEAAWVDGLLRGKSLR